MERRHFHPTPKKSRSRPRLLRPLWIVVGLAIVANGGLLLVSHSWNQHARLASAQEQIKQMRAETSKVAEIAESQTSRTALLTYTSSITAKAAAAETDLAQCDWPVSQPRVRATQTDLLKAIIETQGTFTEAIESVRDAASGGLDENINTLAAIDRRLEQIVGPQIITAGKVDNDHH